MEALFRGAGMRNNTFSQGKILEILTLMAQVQLQRPQSRTALKQVKYEIVPPK